MGPVIGLVLAIVAGVALLTILFGKMIQWLLEGLFAKAFTEREAAIASFSAILGGSVGYLILDWSANPLIMAEKVGSLLGLLGLWWVLFRRRQAIG